MSALRDGREFVVYEHSDRIHSTTGWMAIGRLLPFDDGVHLRSPGMIIVSPEQVGPFRSSAAAYRDAFGPLLPGLALEAFIGSEVYGIHVPRAVKPAPTRRERRSCESRWQPC